MSNLSPEEHLHYKELLNDALKCPRLTAWETSFVEGLWKTLETYGSLMRLSEKQKLVLRRLEKEKIYV